MKLSEYIKSKRLGLNVKTLAKFSGLHRATLDRQYNDDPRNIDWIIEHYKLELGERNGN